jgi:glycosyltransferase involved in cell wall biosynthesis
MNDVLVSIITPCYNSEKYIEQTLLSVINQTYSTWELLITDDCSTDSTIDIIRKYARADGRIKLFSTETNSGHPSIPRNISLSHADGEFVAFLDSDDMWDDNKLEEQVLFMRETNSKLACSYCRVIDDNGVETGRILKTKDNASYTDMLKRYELLSPTIICTRGVAARLNFPSCPKEDYIAWLQIAKMGITIRTTQTVNASYRINPNSRSRNKYKMVLYQWRIYRNNEHFSLLHSCYYLIVYTIKTTLRNYF